MADFTQENYFEGELPVPLQTDDFGVGTQIRTFDIVQITPSFEGHEVLLNLDLDSGYELENAKLTITEDDLAGYETNDIHQAVKYALGFFDHHEFD